MVIGSQIGPEDPPGFSTPATARVSLIAIKSRLGVESHSPEYALSVAVMNGASAATSVGAVAASAFLLLLTNVVRSNALALYHSYFPDSPHAFRLRIKVKSPRKWIVIFLRSLERLFFRVTRLDKLLESH